MEKQQAVREQSNEIRHGMAKGANETRGMANSGMPILHNLTRLRIERNRAARHARCAAMSK